MALTPWQLQVPHPRINQVNKEEKQNEFKLVAARPEEGNTSGQLKRINVIGQQLFCPYDNTTTAWVSMESISGFILSPVACWDRTLGDLVSTCVHTHAVQ
ncbi:unnamed protein product [Natator depressus]